MKVRIAHREFGADPTRPAATGCSPGSLGCLALGVLGAVLLFQGFRWVLSLTVGNLLAVVLIVIGSGFALRWYFRKKMAALARKMFGGGVEGDNHPDAAVEPSPPTGADVPSGVELICSQCGAPLRRDQIDCPRCGAKN